MTRPRGRVARGALAYARAVSPPAAVTLASIHVYPLKSARGIALDRATVERRGLAWDRRWVAVEPGGAALTQRTVPRLATIDVAIDEGRLRLARDGGPP